MSIIHPKSASRSAIFGALLLVALPAASHATTYYVSPGGASTNSGLSQSSPWTLAKSLSSLAPGDICQLLPGAYTASFAPLVHGTANARITYIGDLSMPAMVTIIGGFECDRSYITVKGVKFTSAVSLGATSATNTARYDSVLYCEMRSAQFSGSKHNVVYRNNIVNSGTPSGVTIAFVFSGWQDWPGTGFNSNAEYNTLKENKVDCGVISWKAFLMRVFAQHNLIEQNQFTARFSGQNGDMQGRYIYNSYYNTFRGNRWTFEADNALNGSPWNCFSLRDSSHDNLFDRDTMLCGVVSGFPMTGRLMNAGVAEWNGQTVNNTWKDCVYRTSSYTYVQMNAPGMVLDHSEFSSSNSNALVFNGGIKKLNINGCTFYSAVGRAFEMGSTDPTANPDSVRITNSIFYSKVANTSEGTIAFPSSSGFTSHNNLFYTPSGLNRAVSWGGQAGTVSGWCSASGRDCNSSGGDPRFVNTSSLGSINLRLGTGSPAIGLAELGRDAGAYPFGDVAPPPPPPPPPVTPPSIANLTAAVFSDKVVTLTWTAPNDGGSGNATAYDIRWSNAAITAGNFDAATAFTPVPVPLPPGTAQSFFAIDRIPATNYYFAIKTSNAAGTWSAISNVVSITTDASDRKTPETIDDLSASP